MRGGDAGCAGVKREGGDVMWGENGPFPKKKKTKIINVSSQMRTRAS
jgi:hypothetical protein